jgi:hypothetical protein
MWPFRQSPFRLLALDQEQVLIMRVVGRFDADQWIETLNDFFQIRPEAACFRLILDVRFAIGMIGESQFNALRDQRITSREKLGYSGKPDGPHALISPVAQPLEALADAHRAAFPETAIHLTENVQSGWQAVIGDQPMPAEIQRFFAQR